MQPESSKIKLASRLFDRGKPPYSNTNKRPLTAKIANRIEKVPDKLPSIRAERSFSHQMSGIAQKSQNRNNGILIRFNLDNDSFPKQNKTLIQPNNIFLDERQLLMSCKVHELMDRMIVRMNPPSPPKEVCQETFWIILA